VYTLSLDPHKFVESLTRSWFLMESVMVGQHNRLIGSNCIPDVSVLSTCPMGVVGRDQLQILAIMFELC